MPEERTPELLRALEAGDPQAARVLFDRYARRLTLLAEQHLNRSLAGKVGGDDVVQSVFTTFFQRCARGEFRIDDSSQLWRLLVRITLRKTRAEYRHYTAAKRQAAAQLAEGDAWLNQALAREPSPDEAAALVDEIRALLHGQPPLHGHILEMRLQGHTVAEIAQQQQIARQTVYRVLHLFQDWLRRRERE